MTRKEPVTLEEAKEALSILAAQCGNAKIRVENKRLLESYIRERSTVGDWLEEVRQNDENNKKHQAELDELRRQVAEGNQTKSTKTV